MTKTTTRAKVQLDTQLHTRAKTYASSRKKSLTAIINQAVKLHLDNLGAPEIAEGGE